LNILIIGSGFIGQTLADAAQSIEAITKIYMYDRHSERAEKAVSSIAKAEPVDDVESSLEDAQLVIEAASHEALRAHGAAVLKSGIDLMVLSIGALVDNELKENLRKTAREHGARIYLPSGAVGGIDCIQAASARQIHSITLTTRKPPSNFKPIPYFEETGVNLEKIAEPTVVYEGDAATAVRLFPKNINIAATISLALGDLEKLEVKVIADPGIYRNQHTVEMAGDFGNAAFVLSNLPSPKNPRTSYLAALSAVALLKKITNEFWVGT
jgi:aspartate dehydrogenase